MKQKHISVDNTKPLRFVIVTLDNHLGAGIDRVRKTLAESSAAIDLRIHAASEWDRDPDCLSATLLDIASADIIVVTMLFMDDHIRAVLPALQSRRDDCDAMICCLCATEVSQLTRMGRFSMDKPSSGPVSLLKRLRGNPKSGASNAGAQQLKTLRRLPKILRFIPGTAQDIRAYFLTLQYWLAGSDENLSRMVCFLTDRYASQGHKQLTAGLTVEPPVEYPEVGVYHPDLPGRMTENPALLKHNKKANGTVGILLMRSYLLAGNTDHYDAVIRELESRGFNVVPAFASGLDARPAVEQYFQTEQQVTIDALLSLTGFSLVGGPAYNDSDAAAALLEKLDVPYISAHALEFQSIQAWEKSESGLTPVEATMMVSIPEIDGSTTPTVFGGHAECADGTRTMQGHSGQIERLGARVERLCRLRAKDNSEKNVAVILFNFPPNSGNTGTAAHLSVFASLFNVMRRLKDDGYDIELPDDIDDLRNQIIKGNADIYGMPANVVAEVAVDDYVGRSRHLDDIEAQWGPAPGKHQTNGRAIFVLGCKFGKLLVAIQPGFGYEGDPMKLLFEKNFAPTHAFAAFYDYLQTDFDADAYLHFGTHGALEFMPGKQVGLSPACWPERLVGDRPNIYLYASNNPSEGLIAKRRSAATVVTYLTPPVAACELYKELLELKECIQAWREAEITNETERTALFEMICSLAEQTSLVTLDASGDSEDTVERLRLRLLELEETLIPYGLHVVGEAPTVNERAGMIKAIAHASHEMTIDTDTALAIAQGENISVIGGSTDDQSRSDIESAWKSLTKTASMLTGEPELDSLSRALSGRFISPAPAGDLIQNQKVLPTGRNMHGLDPFRIPSSFAMKSGQQQAERILQRHLVDGNTIPESIALVLWGTDNLKSSGAPIAQALALMGATPRIDSYGRVCGAELIPLATLGRPRIDVVITLSGIFRDLLPVQTKLLAEAAFLCACADEPVEQNFIRKRTQEWIAKNGGDIEAAALRVFSNANGVYGSNVNLLIDDSGWESEDELADAFSNRKCFAYGLNGEPSARPELFRDVLSTVDMAYQNLDSVELGVTTVDHYFDTLGGISRAIKKSSGNDVPVYISDDTSGHGLVRTLSEQVELETRTRMLNPKWFESMLEHGYEGVRQLESHVTNTMGWSATTGKVEPWIYQRLTEAFILDEQMRERLAKLNPSASLKFANRLIEAHEREYWSPDQETLDALREAGADLEDRVEGLSNEAAA